MGRDTALKTLFLALMITAAFTVGVYTISASGAELRADGGDRYYGVQTNEIADEQWRPQDALI